MKTIWRRIRHAAEAWFDRLLGSFIEEYDYPPPAPVGTEPESPDGAAPPAPEPESPDGAAPSAPILNWRYGGFNGAGAEEDAACRIGGLRMDRDGLAFHWDTGIPSSWARHDSEKGRLVIAAAFYWDGEKWNGGKFDWIDEKRTSRSFENIRDGYGGWDASAFFAAPRRAFCVCDADGKRRSNLLETT